MTNDCLAQGQGQARVDEGAMLTLLNMAARHASVELATRAWALLQCSLAPPAHLQPGAAPSLQFFHHDQSFSARMIVTCRGLGLLRTWGELHVADHTNCQALMEHVVREV